MLNTGLILGLCAAIWQVPTARTQIYRSAIALIAAVLLAAVFLEDAQLQRGEGAIMLGLLGAYLYFVGFRDSPSETEVREVSPGPGKWLDAGMLALGVAAVLWGSQLLITSSTRIAHAAG